MCASASILITVLMNFQNVSYKTHITVVKGFYKCEATYLRTHTTTAKATVYDANEITNLQ